ncbi:MAG: GNAT family N-acetyltransferase, partial [Idiomarina sp. 34-48-12]
HIHCYTKNLASRAMIEACGGVFHSEINDNGSLVSRYLIDIK